MKRDIPPMWRNGKRMAGTCQKLILTPRFSRLLSRGFQGSAESKPPEFSSGSRADMLKPTENSVSPDYFQFSTPTTPRPHDLPNRHPCLHPRPRHHVYRRVYRFTPFFQRALLVHGDCLRPVARGRFQERRQTPEPDARIPRGKPPDPQAASARIQTPDKPQLTNFQP